MLLILNRKCFFSLFWYLCTLFFCSGNCWRHSNWFSIVCIINKLVFFLFLQKFGYSPQNLNVVIGGHWIILYSYEYYWSYSKRLLRCLERAWLLPPLISKYNLQLVLSTFETQCSEYNTWCCVVQAELVLPAK